MSFELLRLTVGSIPMLFLCGLLVEWRASRERIAITIALALAAIVGLNAVLLSLLDFETFAQITVPIDLVATFFMFAAVSKYRGFRLLFSHMTGFLICFVGVATGGGVAIATGSEGLGFAVRLALDALVIVWVWRVLRPAHLEMMRTLSRGWALFCGIPVFFFVVYASLGLYPTTIIDRPENVFPQLMLTLLCVVTYQIIYTLFLQTLRAMRAEANRRLLAVQARALASQIESLRSQDQAARIERHDLRHRIRTLDGLLAGGEVEEARAYLAAAGRSVDEGERPRFCENLVVDAVLAHYARRAEREGASFEARVALGPQPRVDPVELSVALANALENALAACADVPEGKRRVVCRCVEEPVLMAEVANPYAGAIEFDADGVPLAHDEGHGLGTRSIAAFAEKHGATCTYRAEDGWFRLQIAL